MSPPLRRPEGFLRDPERADRRRPRAQGHPKSGPDPGAAADGLEDAARRCGLFRPE